MGWQFPPYVILLILSTLISMVLAIYAWKRRQTPGSAPFALLMLAVGVWSFSYALGLMSTNLSAIYFWAKVEYLGIVSIPALWLIFAIQYTGREQWLTRRNLILLCAVPVIILLLVWTSRSHGLFYAEIGLETIDSFVIMTLTPGVVYWLNVIYTYLLFLAGTSLFIQMALHVSRPYRKQISIIVGGMLIVLFASILYLLGITPIPYLELEPMVFTLMGLVIAWGMFRYNLLDIVPVAREKIVENMSDGVIVFDVQLRVVDINPAAESMIGCSAADVIGKTIEQIPFVQSDLVKRFDGVAEVHKQVLVGERADQHYYDVRISPIYDRKDELTGRMMVLRDITEIKQTERALQQRTQELALFNWIGRAFSSSLDLDEVLELVLEETRHLLNVKIASFWLKIPDTDELVCRHATGVGYDIVSRWRLPIGQGLVGWAAEHGKSIIVDDAQADERHFKGVDEQTGLTLRSIMSIPLLIKQEVIGVLNLADTEVERFTQEDLALLEPLATSAAIAIENARLHTNIQTELDKRRGAEKALRQLNEELEERVEARTQELQAEIVERLKVEDELQDSLAKVRIAYEQASIYARQLIEEIAERRQAQAELKRSHDTLVTLNSITTMISQSPDLNHILETTLDLVLAIVEPADGYLRLLDKDTGKSLVVIHKGLSPEIIKVIETLPSSCLSLPSNQPDPEVDSSFVGLFKILEENNRYPLIKINLKSKENVVGCIHILSRTHRELDEEQVQLLDAIGQQVGIAVENEQFNQQAAEVRVIRELDHLRSELVGNISHELRTPLGLIKAASTTLLRKDIEFEQEIRETLLQGIDEETERLEHIVNNLLDLSRLEQKRLVLERTATDIGRLIRHIVESMQPQMQPDLRVVYDLPAQPVVLDVDAKHIAQVLRNLSTNAIKYSPDGGTITVKARQNREELVVQFGDQGVGIPATELDKIFERFYRVNDETTHDVSGVGLGLAISRELIEAHGGRMWAESELGSGSSFYFTLPLGTDNGV